MSYQDLRFDQQDAAARTGLAQRIVGGEVVVYRQALQAFDLYDLWREATLRGITKSVGKAAADRCLTDGFHRIHEWVSPTKIPELTDAVYAEIDPLASEFLERFMSGAFPDVDNFYYEKKPNVRFHIPYDLAQSFKKEFDEFAKDHGQGKIAAHGPHRDSWLDCPSNGLNLWFAMGRIRPGNGLTIYPEDYEGEYKFQPSGDIADGQKLHKAISFDLHPGDVVMFHTDHVHGSELNRTNETRFAISCRLSIDKPHFPNLHYHHYVNANWHKSAALRPLAELPAMFQPSFVNSLATRARFKLLGEGKPVPAPTAPEIIGTKVGDVIEVALADLPVGEVHGVSAALCVARLSEHEVVALTRRCPHAGGDLANGWVDGDAVVCPWHNLPYSARSGKSACESLPALKRVFCEIRGEKVIIDPKSIIAMDDGSDVAGAYAAAASDGDVQAG